MISGPGVDYDELLVSSEAEDAPQWQQGEPDVARLPADSEHLRWLAFYLQRAVLCVFIVSFVAFAVAVEVLLALSNRYSGLGASTSDFHYLYVNGPTAIFTIVAAFWHRVETQAKLTAPWVRLSQGPQRADRTISLDYMSDWQPRALVKAVVNRDVAVACAITVSLAIASIIVVSTGLITLSSVTLSASVPVLITSTFVNNNSALQDTNSLPYYAFQGLLMGAITEPDGVSAQYAYQTVNTTSAAVDQYNTTVDGFLAGLRCEEARLVTPLGYYSNSLIQNGINLELSSPNCSLWLATDILMATGGLARFMQGSCGNSTALDDQRVAIFFGTWKDVDDVSADSPPEFLKSTQLICQPTYNIHRVNLMINSTQMRAVSPSADPEASSLSNVHPWDVMAAHFSSHPQPDIYRTQYTPVNGSGSVIMADPYFYMALLFHNLTLPVSALLDKDVLQDVMTASYQQSAALVAHANLLRPASIASDGTAIIESNRLLVRPFGAHLLSSLLALSALLGTVIWILAPKRGFLSRSPGTILGNAALLSNSRMLVSTFEGLGASSQQKLLAGGRYALYQTCVSHQELAHGRLRRFYISGIQTSDPPQAEIHRGGTPADGKAFRPMVLMPACRLAALAVAVGIIIALQFTLAKSRRDDGLGTVLEDAWLHYLWTIMPAIVLSSLVMFFAAVDFETRVQAPYFNMQRPSTLKNSIGLDLLDALTPVVVARELRVRNMVAFAATFALQVGSLLTIFSGSLFYEQSTSVATDSQLKAVSSFRGWAAATSNNTEPDPMEATAAILSLLLWGNLSYPADSYEDLIFPGYHLSSDLEKSTSQTPLDPSSVTVRSTVPVLRPRLTCRQYPQPAINAALVANHTRKSFDMTVSIEGELGCDVLGNIGTNYNLGSTWNDGELPSKGLFGSSSISTFTSESGRFLMYTSCSQLLYIWGSYNTSTSSPSVAVSAMGCNETAEVVDVDTTFLGTSLQISLQDPPRPIDNSSRPAVSFDLGNPVSSALLLFSYEKMANASGLMDSFFNGLTGWNSRYSIPTESLADPSRAAEVGDAINHMYSIVRAQELNIVQRVPADQADVIFSARSAEATSDAELSYRAVVTDPMGQQRVVQDPAATRAIQGLLAGVIAFALGAWILTPRTKLLPRSPTSIASLAALIADGNLCEFLPEGEEVEWMRDTELARYFSDNTRFQLGWRVAPKGGIGERYGIWAVEEDD
ncbi:hypothetical protein GQ53DRAFT_883340 [Thozetella sp. PMI_491]|nr:hypothetical protein GQ53DRAFT_883340 [Thozetella sp. PMI_491]